MPTPQKVDRRSPVPSAATRLRNALAALTARDSKGDPAGRSTVSELCRVAHVSRNSLYRYHLGILKALRKHQCRRRSASTSKVGIRNVTLRLDMEKLAALVDHYYAAYCETAALLERRERELADLRRKLAAKPIPMPATAGRSPTTRA